MKAPIGFYVGGYAHVGEEGILKCAFDGKQTAIRAANRELEKPSWVLAHPTMPLIYAVEELSPEGRLAVLEDQGDRLKLIASMSTDGADPCHISLAPDLRHLLVSNYSSGSLTVYELNEMGLPCRVSDFVQHKMTPPDWPGRNPVRQDAPHVHFAFCDGKKVYVNDLGLDRLHVYGWDPAEGKLTSEMYDIGFPGGSGPRHLAFDTAREHMYVLCELDFTVHVFRSAGDGSWARVQAVSAIPEGCRQIGQLSDSTGAAIHFADPNTLCASVRGLDCLALIRVNDDGLLGDRQIVHSGGRTPRDFLPAQGYLFAANQGSDCIQAFRREGMVCVPIGEPMAVKKPTCLCLAQ